MLCQRVAGFVGRSVRVDLKHVVNNIPHVKSRRRQVLVTYLFPR